MASNANGQLDGNLGIWHTTSTQAAKQKPQPQQSTFHTITTVGQKRSIAGALVQSRLTHTPGPDSSQSSKAGTTRATPSFNPASKVLAQEQPRLRASRIVRHVVDAGAVLPDGPSLYSQRRDFPSTPTPALDPLLSLSHPAYQLPPSLVANFAALGIKSIYPWQKQCLLGPGLLEGGRNLVYSAPTGGGKSLVADVLMLKRVLADRGAKALLVLPYVALVQEKVRWLRNLVRGISRRTLGQEEVEDKRKKLWAERADKDTIRVVGFFGGSKVKATWADFDIGICTIEKVRKLSSRLGERERERRRDRSV